MSSSLPAANGKVAERSLASEYEVNGEIVELNTTPNLQVSGQCIELSSIPSIKINGQILESTSDETISKLDGKSGGLPETDLSDLLPVPPDGGWGWMVVFSSFMIHFVLDGICYAFGTMLQDYADYFNCSAAATAALMSTLIGCYLLSAPVVSALVNKYGCRPVGMAGAIIAAAGFIVSTLSTSIEMMIVLLGVIGGIGFGMMYLPAVVSVSLYFEKKRAIAIGIAMCGSGIGTFTFGPFGKWLLELMDWKNVHFVLASFILQCVVFSSFVKPLTPPNEKKRKGQATPSDDVVKNGTEALIRSDESAITAKEQNVVGSLTVIRSTPYLGVSNANRYTTTMSEEQVEDLKRPMYKKDVFYSGSVYNLKEYQSTSNVREYVASIVTIPSMNEEPTRKDTFFMCKCLPSNMSDILNEMLDLSLFLNPVFTIIFVAVLMLMLAYFTPFAFCSRRAEANGVDEKDASLLISVLGLSTLFGRLGACLIATIPNLRSITLHNAFLFGAGLSALFVPLSTTYVTMAITAFGYGLFMGGHVSLSPIVLVDCLGLQRLTSSFGLMTLARGISTLAGPPLAGYLYDTTSSYDPSFYLGGSLIIVSTFTFCLLELPCINKNKNNDNKNVQDE